MKIALIIILAIVGVLLLRAGLVLLSVPAYKLYWHKKALEPVKPNTVTLISLGDSAAQGVGASSPSYSYVGRLATAIEKQTKRPVKVINLSESGAKIPDVTKKQLPKLAKLKLDGNTIITLDIGTNDVTRGSYEGDAFTNQLNELFAQLPKQTVVADMPYLGKSRWAKVDSRIKIANEILHAEAAKNNLQVAPLYNTLKAHGTIRKFSGDFFHPSNYGYSLWFEAFWPAVDEQLKQF